MNNNQTNHSMPYLITYGLKISHYQELFSNSHLSGLSTFETLVVDKCENEDLTGRTAEEKTVTTLKQEPPDVADDDDAIRTESHDKAESEVPKFKEDTDRVEEDTPKIEAKREPHDERHGEVPAKEEVPAREEEKSGVVEGPATAIKTESEERQSRSPSSESNSLEKAVGAENEEEATPASVNAAKKGMLCC